jgi:hypothetical protein
MSCAGSMADDLLVIFHPVRTCVLTMFTPVGAVGSRGWPAEISSRAAGLPVALSCAA